MRTQINLRKPVVGASLALAVVTALFIGAQSRTIQAQDRSLAVQHLRDMSDAFIQIAEKTSPAVVFIDVEAEVKGRNVNAPESFQGPGDDLFQRFFGPQFRGRGQPNQPMPRQFQHGQGSGFIISPDGYVVTNGHVVANAESINVTLGDGRAFKGKVVGVDKPSDIAVVKIEDGNLPYLKLGDSDALRVGEIVVAIGNPFGLSHTVTQGIVSAKGRNAQITNFDDLIQTDAAINPGNSGGPLINLDGEVVGMNTAILSRTGGNLGIGFAIPVNAIRDIKDTLISGKTVERGFLGVGLQNVTPDMAKYFKAEPNKGAIIAEISKDSPAAKSGLKQDDIVLQFDGKPVKDRDSLRNMVAMTKPESTAKLTILRDGKEETVSVAVGKRDDEQLAAAEDQAAPAQLGLSLQNLTPDLAQQFGFEDKTGIVVTGVEQGSPAERAGIEPGMLIQEVNRMPVANVAQFKKVVSEAQGDIVLVRLTDGTNSRYVTLHKE
jgi:serine protease Do